MATTVSRTSDVDGLYELFGTHVCEDLDSG